MSSDAQVLRAMLRLARRRQGADEAAIATRVAASPREVRAALRDLVRAGLAARAGAGTWRLTMPGLAVAIAMLPARAAAPKAARRASRAA
jgi:DNA-binding IclR family transcriptional regulator